MRVFPASIKEWRGFPPNLVRSRISLIVILALLSRLIYITFTVDPEYDSYDRFVKGILLLPNPYDFRHHWCWLPLFQYIDSILYWLTGSYTSVRIFSTICGSTSIILLYKITLKVSGLEEAAFISSLLMAFNPLVFIYDTTGMTEPFFTMLLLSVLYFFIHDRVLLGSIPIAISCLVRYEAWFLSPILYFLVLVRRRSKPWVVVLSGLIPSASIGLWLYINYAYYGDPLKFLKLLEGYLATRLQRPSLGEGGLLSVETFLLPFRHLVGYLLFLTPPVFFEAILGIKRCVRRDLDTITLAVLALSYLSLHTYFLISGRSEGWFRYCIPGIPIFIFFAAHHVVKREKKLITPYRFLSASLILSLASIVVMTIWNIYAMTPILETSLWLKTNAKDGRILCIRTPIMVLSGIPVERFVFLWSRDIDRPVFLRFLERENVSYVVSHFGYYSNLCENFTVVFSSTDNLYTIYMVNRTAVKH